MFLFKQRVSASILLRHQGEMAFLCTLRSLSPVQIFLHGKSGPSWWWVRAGRCCSFTAFISSPHRWGQLCTSSTNHHSFPNFMKVTYCPSNCHSCSCTSRRDTWGSTGHSKGLLAKIWGLCPPSNLGWGGGMTHIAEWCTHVDYCHINVLRSGHRLWWWCRRMKESRYPFKIILSKNMLSYK